MKYSDIYRLYSTSQPEDAIHQALREVPVDDSDEQYEGRCPLHLACRYEDAEAVRILLERDAEPNVKDTNGSTPIHILGRTSAGRADEDKLKEIAVMLMEHGANISRSAKNTTALIECVRNRHFKMAEAIIDSGARVNSTDLNGENVLFGLCAASDDIKRDIRFTKKELDEAIQYRYPENKIEEIRSRIARLEDDDETAYRLARRLVEEGKVDPEDKSNSGKTAWDAAIENKAMKIAAFLSGSDPDVDELSALHGNMDIFQAMYMKDMEALDAILRSGVDLQMVCEYKDMYDFGGKSPLACAFSWFDTIQDAPAMILNGGADPNYRFPNEETAFSVWVSKDYFCRDTEVYKGLLDLMKEKGWNPELPVDAEGNTALALSCRHTGYRLGKTAFSYLLKGKAAPNTANLSGQTPMMILFGGHKANEKYTPYGWSASSHSLSEILEKLLEVEADVDKTDNRGNTFLHYVAVCCCGSIAQKTIELLLDFKLLDVNAVNNEGRTPLICLLDNKRTDAALFLMDQGADTEVADASGHKAIDYATAHGLREVVARFSYGSDRDARGNTPLHQAVYNGQGEIVRTLLMSDNSMLDSTNDGGETPLILACMQGNFVKVNLLLGAGSDPGKAMLSGNAPIHYAAISGNRFIGEALLKAKAMVDAQNDNGETPLILAAREGYNDFVSVLLEYHANASITDNLQHTVLYYAGESGFNEIVEKLLENGAE